MNKVFILGLDGATFRIIDPLIDRGLMPHMKELMDNGVKANLISTLPPLTAPAWYALSTGLNPGKTGIHDFQKRKSINSNRLTTVNSTNFKDISLWDILSKQNKKVAIINYPMLFPPYEINGYMISGIGSSWHEDLTYPRNLKKDMAKWTDNKYRVLIKPMDDKYENEDLFVKDLYSMMENRLKVVKNLMKRDWDFFFSVFVASDRIQHLMWKWIDKDHPLYRPEKEEKYRPIFEKFWSDTDAMVGEIYSNLDENTNFMIVSDHGFGPARQSFNISKWLIDKGYMKLKKTKSKSLSVPEAIKNRLIKLRYSWIRKLIPDKIFRNLYENILSVKLNKIDFDNSSAYTLLHAAVMGMIYISDKSIKDKLIHELKNIGQDIGKPADVDIFLKEDIYKGNRLNELPDILLSIDDWKTYFKHTSLTDSLFDRKPYSDRMSGKHRPEGIFIASGPDFKKGVKADDLSIYDIAPSTLYLMNSPVPSNMDGRIIRDLMEGISREPEYFSLDRGDVKEEKYDEDKVKQRLKDLGYFG